MKPHATSMSELPDLELHRTPSDSSPPNLSSTRSIGLWVAVAVLMAAAGVAVYVVWRPRPAPAPAATRAPTAVATEPSPPLGGPGEPITIPPLDASDALVRTLVRSLSENPAVAAWLTTNDLIRNFTVVTANIAEGATPAKHLKVLRPTSAFEIVDRGGVPMWTRQATTDMRRSRTPWHRSTLPAPPSCTGPSSHALRRRIGNWDFPIGHLTERSNARLLRSSRHRSWTHGYGSGRKGSATHMPMNGSRC